MLKVTVHGAKRSEGSVMKVTFCALLGLRVEDEGYLFLKIDSIDMNYRRKILVL